jgi:hypothetical protein
MKAALNQLPAVHALCDIVFFTIQREVRQFSLKCTQQQQDTAGMVCSSSKSDDDDDDDDDNDSGGGDEGSSCSDDRIKKMVGLDNSKRSSSNKLSCDSNGGRVCLAWNKAMCQCVPTRLRAI